MLLTISTTGSAHSPATDLGYLLHKNPARPQSSSTSVGDAHVFYPEATELRCTAALLLEVDPVGLVRGNRGTDGSSLGQYVNDRPYAASSLLAVALAKSFKTAMSGRCDLRPELAAGPMPLQIHLPSLPSRGDPELVDKLFAPLGWTVTITPIPLDPTVPNWGNSPYVDLLLDGNIRLADALNHLYVLLPVLDDAKHYWVGNEEIEKLLRAGGNWLADHPERDLITRRYLKHQRGLIIDAAARILETESPLEEAPPATPLRRHRLDAVLAALRECGAARIVDLGCGEGALLRELVADYRFGEIVGVDVSPRELDRAARALHLDDLSDTRRARITLLQSSLLYADERLTGYDALVLMEVIEHVDRDRLPALEHNVFAIAGPSTAIVTTPNIEFNIRYTTLPNGFRHPDHRYEFSRAEFNAWCEKICDTHGYLVDITGVGNADPDLGSPTQMAVFTKAAR